MAKTNYDNIDGKSVWDLYVENFRNDLWDLAPKFAWDAEGGGLRVVTDEDTPAPPKPKKRKATKKTTAGMTKTGRVGDKVDDVVADTELSVADYKWKDTVLEAIIDKYEITDRDAFLVHATAFDANKNLYLTKKELTQAAKEWVELTTPIGELEPVSYTHLTLPTNREV